MTCYYFGIILFCFFINPSSSTSIGDVKKSRKKEFQRRFETSSFVQRMVKTPKSTYGWLFKKYFHPSLTTLNLITACYNAHTSQQCDVLISCVAISDEINSCQEWGWAFDEIQDEIPCQFLGISNLPTDHNFTTHFPAIIFIPCFNLAYNKPLACFLSHCELQNIFKTWTFFTNLVLFSPITSW